MLFSLTWLPHVLLDAGLKVAEQPGWQNRGRGDVGPIKGVICHHTAGPMSGNMPSLGIITNGRPDLPALSPSLVWDAMARCMWLQPAGVTTRELAIGRASRAAIRISLGSKPDGWGSPANRSQFLSPRFRWMPTAEA